MPAHEHTPDYYRLPVGLPAGEADLTDLFLARYGVAAVAAHLQMELEQYAWRCRQRPEAYAQDLQKMATITAHVKAVGK